MKRQEEVELLLSLIESLGGDSADVYLLFIDLCGSTGYKQQSLATQQSDVNWIFRQLVFLQRTAKIVGEYQGTVVKTIGDAVFAFFDVTSDPEHVLKCAIEVIQSFGNLKAYRGSHKIEVKASIDFGLTYNGTIIDTVPFDPIGLPVDRCARLNSLANTNQILFSDDFFTTVQQRSSHKDVVAKYGCTLQTEDLKGIGPTKYYRIDAK